MKTKRARPINIIEGGREELEGTNEFRNKVDEIRKELTHKYSLTLSTESNWIRRLLIKVKLEIEIRKRIQALSSLKNLHIIKP